MRNYSRVQQWKEGIKKRELHVKAWRYLFLPVRHYLLPQSETLRKNKKKISTFLTWLIIDRYDTTEDYYLSEIISSQIKIYRTELLVVGGPL